MKQIKWDLEEIGLVPYRPSQPIGWPDLSDDWISPELILRRIVFAKKFSFTKNNFYGEDHNIGPRNWSPIHMLQSNFDQLEAILNYLSLNETDWKLNPKSNKLHPYNVIQTLFPSKWMVSA